VKYTDPTGLDNVIAIFNRDTGHLSLTYYSSANDVGSSAIRTYEYELSNHVRNELNGERSQPNAITTPADGGESQFYYPREMPLGEHNLGTSRPPSDPAMGSIYIPTDAEQYVPVYGPYSPDSPIPASNAVATGTQLDTGYGFHRAVDVSNPSSWGCGVTFGDNADNDIAEIAGYINQALNSGGTARVRVEE
jgi:hypothetical protein